jgi:hypothetical protein
MSCAFEPQELEARCGERAVAVFVLPSCPWSGMAGAVDLDAQLSLRPVGVDLDAAAAGLDADAGERLR